MTDIRLSDEEWGKIRALLRQESYAYVGRDEAACRRFVEAVKWMSRSGPMALAAGRVWRVEHRVQAVCALV